MRDDDCNGFRIFGYYNITYDGVILRPFNETTRFRCVQTTSFGISSNCAGQPTTSPTSSSSPTTIRRPPCRSDENVVSSCTSMPGDISSSIRPKVSRLIHRKKRAEKELWAPLESNHLVPPCRSDETVLTLEVRMIKNRWENSWVLRNSCSNAVVMSKSFSVHEDENHLCLGFCLTKYEYCVPNRDYYT